MYNYEGCIAYSAKGYLDYYRNGYVNVSCCWEIIDDIIVEISKIINYESLVDVYTYGVLLYKYGDSLDKMKAYVGSYRKRICASILCNGCYLL